MISRNPLLIIVLNFLVGFLISQGWASPEQKDDLVNAFAEVIGIALIFITSIFSLVHTWKHGHISNITKTTTTTEIIPIDEASSTEPLPTDVQEKSSTKLFSHHAE